MRTPAGDTFKIFMKTREIIKAAFKTQTFQTGIRFYQQLTGMPYP